MACYYPQTVFQAAWGGPVSWVEQNHHAKSFEIPCGRCIGCRLERSRVWAVRICHENQLHKHGAFVTLTYDDEKLPPLGSLDRRDVQLFHKRLRKVFPSKSIRYYCAGEYGEQLSRPHYHDLLWGTHFNDYRQVAGAGSHAIYTSPTLQKLWGLGNVYVGEINFESAAYVARYCVDKVNGDLAKTHYAVIDSATGEVLGYREPEFALMSRKPGIGAGWLDKYQRDAYPRGMVEMNGKLSPTPRYYDKLWSKENPDLHEAMKMDREVQAYARREENTTERLAVKEHVKRAHLKLKQRHQK